ncbi:hypothetical protein ABBQ38_015264 [Trebouxia sp. C0009 RCD-2024]
MPSVLQFITGLKLEKEDHTALVQHVQDSHATGGPSLDDRCTNKVRKYLKEKPPLGLSWHGSIKLDDELTAGFTSKEAYQMGIPAIGIVAVLVANVTFITWSTPPGGPTPYWQGCDYPMFTSFLIVDGVAFMLAVASVIVVTAFPLVLKRHPHQAAWWGGTLLLLSMIAFIGAFLLAGFVTVAYKAPDPGCASLKCQEGGVHCTTYAYTGAVPGFYWLDPNVAALNNLVSAGNGSYAVCLRYNASVATSAETVTLLPTIPGCPGADDFLTNREWDNCPDIRELLENEYIQQQVVCMPPGSLPQALPTTDSSTFTINISASTLRPYTSLTQFYQADRANYITDLIVPNNVSQTLVSYAELTYKCHSRGDETAPNIYNTLCDVSQNLSVSKTGAYTTEATASTVGAVVFHADRISRQLAITVEALSGFFGLVLLIIVGYLIKSKIEGSPSRTLTSSCSSVKPSVLAWFSD